MKWPRPVAVVQSSACGCANVVGPIDRQLRTVFGRPYYRSSLWYSISSVCRLSVVCLSSVTFCIVAKRCVLVKKCLKE